MPFNLKDLSEDERTLLQVLSRLPREDVEVYAAGNAIILNTVMVALGIPIIAQKGMYSAEFGKDVERISYHIRKLVGTLKSEVN